MSLRAIVLAAGKGTRMKSALPKVLHELCGRPMIWYVLRVLQDVGADETIVVSSPDSDEKIASFGLRSVVQQEQLGTGHAVQVALEQLAPQSSGRVLIVNGDMPLVEASLLRSAIAALDQDDGNAPSAAMVTANMPLPSNFGRVLRLEGDVQCIVEARDASEAQLAITEMNAGIYAYDEAALRDSVRNLRNDNAQKEYYLTDAIAALVSGGKRVVPVQAPNHAHVLGINDRVELAVARREMNARLCEAHMRNGVTIVDPATTYLEPELAIGSDTVIYPGSSISRLSQIGQRCVIGPNTRLSNARLGDGVTVRESLVMDSTTGDDVWIGPYAHLRNNAVLGNRVKIGNFVEVKDSRLGDDVKANHLTYIGDADVGEETNIGAGTITCNYEHRSKEKNKTRIGRNVSIGSNTSLIAPVTIGDGALTGAGAVVTKDVPPGERVAGNPARKI